MAARPRPHSGPATRLLLLGTGNPLYRPGVAQQSAAILDGGQAYLVDCGDGTMLRLAEALARGVDEVAFPRLTRLFLTHLHPDHTAGLAGLIVGTWVQERREPLQIYGPPGTHTLVQGLLDAYAGGIEAHREGLAPMEHELLLATHEYEAGLIYEDERLLVEAFPVAHGGVRAFGLKFVSATRTIVHSGDTRPCAELIKQARGCDILIHEVYHGGALDSRPAAWQRYHRSAHTSAPELAAIAAEVRPGLLVLNHQLSWGDGTDESLLEELTSRYDGPVHYGRDLDLID